MGGFFDCGVAVVTAYYNEIDPFAAAWLRELISAGHIAPGEVDERSIEDVKPIELAGFTQCHFFAGIGGWSLALRQAGWPDDKPVWTGSCPCQPFSAAGKGGGFDDERHLWPAFHWLIQQCRPATIFGEQVASKAADDWIDLVHADMEAMGYAFGCVPFPAAGIGAPQLGDRTYWVGAPQRERLEGQHWNVANRYRPGRVAACADRPTAPTGGAVFWDGSVPITDRNGVTRPIQPGISQLANGVSNRVGKLRGYGNAIVPPQAAEFIKCLNG